MSRGYSPEDRHVSPESNRYAGRDERPVEPEPEGQTLGRSGGEETPPRAGLDPDTRTNDSRTIDPRKACEFRRRTYVLRSFELQTMAEIGKFRALDAKDLGEFAYAGNPRHLVADLANLRRQGLILEREIPREEASPRRLVALTKEGHRLLLTTKTVRKDQVLYHGFTKPREAHHDADLYRLYQRGLERIKQTDGKSVRVILDSELKKKLYRDLAATDSDSPQARIEVAGRHGLRIVRGNIPVPDVRIEYETSDGDLAHVDLELATEHYRARNLAQKAGAGFSIYARPQDASNLRRVLDQQELTAEVLRL